MSVPFVNHHAHTHFSTLDGLSKPMEYAKRAVELGQTSITVTDHGTLAGIPQMYKAAKEYDLGFTPGIEAYFTQDRKYKHDDKLGSHYYHLILLAHNYKGYENLIRMQTPSFEEGFYYKPRLDYEILDEFSDGIIATTACLGGIVNQLLLRGDYQGAINETSKLVDIFGKENVYVEVQRHGIADQEKILGDQVKIAKDLGLKLLATNDSHYTNENEADLHDTLLCCSASCKGGIVGSKFREERMKFDGDGLNYLHSGERMLELFPEEDFPGAVSNSIDIAKRTDFHMPIGENKYILPKIPTEGKTEEQALYEHVMAGASDPKRYGDDKGNIPDYVKERIEGELKVINNMGFPGYFLIVENFIKLFAERGIYVGHGRGCLHKDTPVITDKGVVKIKDVKPGYKVIDARGMQSKVLECVKHPVYEGEELIKITREDGESISLTEKHKVLTMDKNGENEWIKAGKIKAGDNIISVVNNNANKYCRIDLGNKSKQLESPEWGYCVGMMMAHSAVKKDTLVWKFNKDQQDVAFTLYSCLTHCYDGDVSTVYSEDGDMKEISLVNSHLAKWVKDNKKSKDIFIGHGSKGFSRGFLQVFQSLFSAPVVSTNHIDTNNKKGAELAWGATLGLGLDAKVDDTTLFIDTIKKSKTQKIHTVIGVERQSTGNSHYVYDLVIEGHPSFLTNFGTVHNSAPGSVVVYCLGITNIDPFRHSLFFERFLNPDRISMPDIDIDVPQTKRQEALSILEEEYGHGHVAQITNYSAMQDKDSLKNVSKAYGFSPSEAERFKDAVDEYLAENGMKLKELAELGVVPEKILEKSPDRTKTKIILEQAAKISGTIKSYGVHACGVVITTEPVDHHFPVRFKMGDNGKSEGLPICQYDGHDVEELGGVKMDILGLINLDEAEDTERNILKDLGEKVDTSDLPLDDPEVYKVLSSGRGGGIFQLGCLSGDTIIDGRKLRHWYQLRHSVQKLHSTNSVFLGLGDVASNKVEKIVHSGKKETISLKLKDSTELICTPGHHIFTQRGWVKAGELDVANDKVFKVKDFPDYSQTVSIRGLEDIMDMAQIVANSWVEEDAQAPEGEDEWVRISPAVPYSSKGETFYPQFHRYGNYEDVLFIYPDNYSKDPHIAYRNMNSEEGKHLTIMSYSEVAEKYFEMHPMEEDDLLPDGTYLMGIKNIEDHGVIDTYDIMMKSPVNNFIANGIMVHNSSGIQELMKMMKPTNFEDISALVALYRPGPMGMKTHVNYAEFKNNPNKSPKLLHPDMGEILKNTHGLVVYQEDIMALSRKFAGYTGAEADTLRKATAKKVEAMMEEQKEKFIPAVSKNYPGTKNLGKDLWDIIEPFGAYAFNKSHSAAYAMLAYRTAWLKAHYPAQFSGACIDYNLSNKDKLLSTIAWIKDEGVEIGYPNVNVSEMRTVTGDMSITLPLNIISGLGDSKALEIIAERQENGEYTSELDFLSRNKIPKKIVENMIKAGAFDCFGHERAILIDSIDKLIDSSAQKKSRNIIMMDSLFSSLIDDEDDEEMVNLDYQLSGIDDGSGKIVEIDDELYAKWEREVLRFIIGPHPFGVFRNLEKAKNIIALYPPIDTFKKAVKNARFSGVITNVVKKQSARGNTYSVFDLETDIAIAQGLCFQQEIGPKANGMTVIIEGSVEDANSEDNRSYNKNSEVAVNEDGEEVEVETVFKPKVFANKINSINVSALKKADSQEREQK